MSNPEETNKPTEDSGATGIERFTPYGWPVEWRDYVAGLNLMQRMHGAMADLAPMEKDRTTSGNNAYKYHGHAAVSATCKSAMEKWRIFASTSLGAHEREPVEMYGKPHFLTTLAVHVTFINIDRPDESLTVESMGYGVDNADKGLGKALTYAVKYAMLKNFQISDGEELDNESMTYDEDGRRERPVNLEEKQNASKPKARPKAEPPVDKQAEAKAALAEAERLAGLKADVDCTATELFKRIGSQVEAMGRSRDIVPAYLKSHCNAATLKEVEPGKLLQILTQLRAKREAHDACLKLVGAATNPEEAQTLINAVLLGRCLFEIPISEINAMLPKLAELAKAAA